MNIPDSLSHKVGPLPAGAWILAIGGGLGVAVIIRRRHGGGDPDAATAAQEAAADASVASADAGAGGETIGTGGAAVSTPGGGTPTIVTYPIYTNSPPPKTTTTPPPKPTIRPTTNAAWRKRVHDELVHRGYRSGLIMVALERYFGHKNLTQPQRHIIDEGITRIGPPPHPPKPNKPGHKREGDNLTATTHRDNGNDTNPGRHIP